MVGPRAQSCDGISRRHPRAAGSEPGAQGLEGPAPLPSEIDAHRSVDVGGLRGGGGPAEGGDPLRAPPGELVAAGTGRPPARGACRPARRRRRPGTSRPRPRPPRPRPAPAWSPRRRRRPWPRWAAGRTPRSGRRSPRRWRHRRGRAGRPWAHGRGRPCRSGRLAPQRMAGEHQREVGISAGGGQGGEVLAGLDVADVEAEPVGQPVAAPGPAISSG